MNNIVIGIEGLVGSGKTSICKELLKYIPNSIILHGGNLYRAIIYALMHNGKAIDVGNLKENIKNIDIKQLMDKLKVDLRIEDSESVMYVDGLKIDDEKLQSKDTSLAVSIAGKNADSSHMYVFAKNLIDMYKEKYNVIVSGRDLMRIYPNLDYHLFITASLDERVRRKMIQYGKEANMKEIRDNIEKRDKLQQESGYYDIYKNTIKIDVTECKDVEESTKKVLSHIKLN
jgi:cytidylate kinase